MTNCRCLAARSDFIRITADFYFRLAQASGVLLFLGYIGRTGGDSAGPICWILAALYIWRFARRVMRSPVSAAVRRGRLAAVLLFAGLPVVILTSLLAIIVTAGR